METLKLTAKDFKKSASYWSDYIGKVDVSNYQGHIEIDSNLGYVRFNKIYTTGYILAKAGSGIEAGLSITCKLALSFSIKCFAGICYFRNIEESEKTITCGKKEGTGVIEYGILKEIGMPEEKTEEPKLKSL